MQQLKFGFELEMGHGSIHWDRAVDVLFDNGLTARRDRHHAHCQCSTCRYDRAEGLMAVQEDSSVSVEFVSRILSTRSVRDRQEMKKLQEVYPDMMSAMNWRPDGYVGTGNHCHVGWPKAVLEPGRTRPNELLNARVVTVLSSLFAADPDLWRSIADGGCGRHREYNGVCAFRPYQAGSYYEAEGGRFLGSWLMDRGHSTLEFRLWNTPLDPKRLMVHPAISVALMTWALEIVDEHSHLPTFDRAVDAFNYVQERALIERKRVVRTIKEIWKDEPSARLAAELVAA